MSDRYDVIVVGGRCAGAATAMLLARRGLRVLVLERSGRGADTLSTHALMRGGVLQLGRWGVLDRIIEAGTPAVRQTRFRYAEQATTISIKPALGVDALYAPRRSLLDRVLIDEAIAAGADVRFGVDATDVIRSDQGRVVGVLGRDRAGGTVRARSWLTVGADGARSLVARRVGAPTLRTGTGSGAIIYGHWQGLDVTGYEWFYRPGSTAGLIPTNDGETCVFAGTSSARFRHEFAGDLAAGYLRLLKEATGSAETRLSAGDAPQRLHAHPGHPGFVRQPWGPGWTLVGDAVHYVDPLSTHGMTDALRDAELLARAVDAVSHGAAEAEAFGWYQATRERIAGPIFAVADEIAGYQWSLSDVRRLLLRLSSAMSDEVEALSSLRADFRLASAAHMMDE